MKIVFVDIKSEDLDKFLKFIRRTEYKIKSICPLSFNNFEGYRVNVWRVFVKLPKYETRDGFIRYLHKREIKFNIN